MASSRAAEDPIRDREPPSPSAWVRRFAPLAPAGTPVLDVACGSGRHTRLFLGRGHEVTAIDLDLGRLGALAAEPRLTAVQADLELDPPRWPLSGCRFGAVVVTNFLWRPLFTHLVAAVGEGGVLIYETFAAGNERFGRPKSADHLLLPGELLERVGAELTVVAYEHGIVERERERQGRREAVVQRIAAVRAALAPVPGG